MNILVTGSCGYLGRPFVEALNKRGHTVKEFDIQLGCDLNDSNNLDIYLRGIDVVDNLAALGDLYDVMDDVDAGYRANVETVIKLGDKCLDQGIRLVHASTCCVYGTQEKGTIINEDTVPHPSEIYAKQKLEAEQILLEMERKGLPLVIARLGTTYGGNMRASQVFIVLSCRTFEVNPLSFMATEIKNAHTHTSMMSFRVPSL